MNKSQLELIVEDIRREHLSRKIPSFHPQYGNESARFLFLLEAPGPMAVKSGFVQLDNDDQTAKNLNEQFNEAGLCSKDIALWNIVPWYLGNEGETKIRGAKSSDVKEALPYLDNVVKAITNLECIVLVGSAARKAHIHLSHSTTARLLSCHHPSPKVQNTVSGAAEENIEVFRFMLALHKTNLT